MKIYATGIPAANLDDIKFKIESNYYDLKQIAALFKQSSIQIIEEVAATTYGMFADIPCAIQDVADAAASRTFTIIKDDGIYVYKNFKIATVAEFTAGQNYLVPISVRNVVPITPALPCWSVATLAGTVGQLFMATHYHFFSENGGTPKGYANSFTAVTFDIDENALVEYLK